MPSSLPPIAFLGLGAMGHGMALHLLEKGYPLTGYDIYAPTLQRFTTAASQLPLPSSPGATTPSSFVAATPRTAVKSARIVIFMVATAAQIRGALFGDGGGAEADAEAAIRGLQEDVTVLLCSTGPRGYAVELEREVKGKGRGDIKWVDCPVSGGAKRAREGTLTILASGKPEVLVEQSVREVLEVLAGGRLSEGGNLWVIQGGLGKGTEVKMVHQVLAGVHIAVTAEVVAFWARLMGEEVEGKKGTTEGNGDKEGSLGLRDMLEGVKAGKAWNWMFENRVGHLLEKEADGKGTVYSALNIIVKDVGIVTNASRALSFPIFLTSTTEQILATSVTSGLGLIDDSSLFNVYLPNQPSLVSLITSSASTSTSPSTTSSSSSPPPSHPKLHLLENLLAAVHTLAAAEALSLGRHVGLDMEQLYRIIEGAAGSSRVFVDRGREIISGEFQAGKTVREVVGELSEVLDVANQLRFPLYLASMTLQLFQVAARRGWGDESDLSVVRIWDAEGRKE